MKKIDIVLAGYNGYGQFYADFLLNNPYRLRYNFRAVADPYLSDEDKIKLARLKIERFDDLDAFYRHNNADMAIIAAPIHFHKPLCEIAAKNGNTVLCEKPATARLCDLLEMHGYEQKYGKDIFIGFQWSFCEPILRLKQDLMNGEFGKIISAKSIVLWGRDLAYFNRTTGWAGKIKTKDGAYVYDSVASNATSHYLNNLLFLLGSSMETSANVRKIDAQCRKANPIESFDTCVIKVKTEENQDILFVASHAATEDLGPVFEICCEKAVISCDFTKNNGALTASLIGGQTKEYGEVNTLYQSQKKIIDVIGWLNGSSNIKPPSTVMTVKPFTEIIDYIFTQAEFRKFEKDVIFDETNQRFYVENLSSELFEIYQHSGSVTD